MKVFDLHSDIFTDIAFRRSYGERRVFERIHLPKLKQAGVTGIIGVFWVEPIFQQKKQRFMELIRYVFDDLNESTMVRVVTAVEELEQDQDKFNLLLGIEGLTFLQNWEGQDDHTKIISGIDELNESFIKHAIFCWNDANFIATGSGNTEHNHTGFSSLGQTTVKHLEQHHWIIDVSHLDERSFWDLANFSNVPLIASHSNARKLCDHERNLTDEQIKEIAKSKGLIGINAYGSFVAEQNPTRSKVIDHICYIADLVGVDHVGFGFDFVDYLQCHDLGDDLSNMTNGLESVLCIPDLLDDMITRGFSYKELEKIAQTNFYRFFSKITG